MVLPDTPSSPSPATQAQHLRSFVGGAWVHRGSEAADINPSRPSEVVAVVEQADEAAAAAAVEAAEAAFARWSRQAAPSRGDVLRRTGDLLEARAESIGRDLAREEGKTVPEGVGETLRAAAIFRYYGSQTLEPDGETYPSGSANTFLYARREPVGVVTAITPWNFPIAIPAWKLAPALAYGNAVVWKPAELVPLTSIRLLEAMVDAGLPSGVVNVILGRGSVVGGTLVSHEAVSAISFTGSNDVGRHIQLEAVAKGKRVQLELGGKNPVVVLADADLDLAAEQVARGAFLSAGQKCTATSRVVVERSVLEPFAERLTDIARSWPVGDALDPATKIGPVASAAQLETVLDYLDLAERERATVLTGGGRAEGDGYFVQPTVVSGLDAGSRVVREEIFGPVVALLPAESYRDALRSANDTPFGLSASIFTRNLDAALDFARNVRAGVVKINQESAGLELHAPFGGTKQSSSGSREQGKAAREFYTEWKTVYVDPGSPS